MPIPRTSLVQGPLASTLQALWPAGMGSCEGVGLAAEPRLPLALPREGGIKGTREPRLTRTRGCSWDGPCRAGWRWRWQQPWWRGQTPRPAAIQVGIWVSGEHKKVGEKSFEIWPGHWKPIL